MDSSPNQIDFIRQSLDMMDRERDKRMDAACARMDAVEQELLEYRKNRPDPLHLGKRASLNDPIIEARNQAMEKMFNDAFPRMVERAQAAATEACIKPLEHKIASEAAHSEDAIAQTVDLVLDHVKPAEALEMVTAEAEEEEDMEGIKDGKST